MRSADGGVLASLFAGRRGRTTESELKLAGVRALIAALGPVDAERFIAAMHREPFDDTRWRSDQWQHATVAGLAEQARTLRVRVATPD